jgi:ATP-binding cassette subfamily B protein
MFVASAMAEPGSPFEPLAIEPTAAPPKASVHPDASLGWFRRVWPVLAVRRGRFFAALAGAVVAMVFGVLLPRVTMAAIDTALSARRAPLSRYLWFLGALGVARAALTYGYRAVLYRVAYDLEYDLRVLLYGHLTRMDFGFYDTVQAGQLISRANSDIRSVQMYCTFAPLLALQLVSFVVAVALMLSIHVGLTLVALATLPITYIAGVRLRNQMFPLSWIVQARAAEVTTVVDESIQGARVVKGFAAEEREVTKLAKASQRLRWASITQADARARWGPLMENLPRLGLAGVLLLGHDTTTAGPAFTGWIQVAAGIVAGFGIGVIVYNNFYADITGNVITDVHGGVQTGNFAGFADESERPSLLVLHSFNRRVRLS